MLEILLVMWVISAILIVFERSVARIVIYTGIFSLITSGGFLLLGSPDVAMAEAAVSGFTIVFFVICLEKYYSNKADAQEARPRYNGFSGLVKRLILPVAFVLGIFMLFVYSVPDISPSTYLKYQYLARFMGEVGGANAVASIVLGYRVYDTLFEALLLIVAVVAVSHMSWFSGPTIAEGRHSNLEKYGVAIFSIRIVSPIILLFGLYIIAFGHVSAGGGFQGGVALASFFVCRYLVYNIYDLPIKRVIRLEEIIFVNIVIVAAIAIFLAASAHLPTAYIPFFQVSYLVGMNILIGFKVACGFFILFYRYITIERLEDTSVTTSQSEDDDH